MNTTDAPNTQCGQFWSMIQPNSSGLTMPPMLKPVETMPKARPAAPAGAALRTSISRDGAITPPRNPAAAIAAVNSSAGIGNFGVVALMSGYGASFSSANIALTAFLGASAIGVLAGGFLADHTQRHGPVAAAGFALNAAVGLIIATIPLPSLLLTAAMAAAGFLGGVIAPSRDMLVRNAAPAGAAGRAFGIVSTGFNLGGIVSPLLFGWIMDQNWPHWVFGASVVFMVLTVLLALVTDRGPQGSPKETDEGTDARLMHS